MSLWNGHVHLRAWPDKVVRMSQSWHVHSLSQVMICLPHVGWALCKVVQCKVHTQL